MTGKGMVRLGFASALAILAACAAASTEQDLPLLVPADQADVVPIGPVSGTWQGTSRSYSNEIRKITLRITQVGLKISGDYSCVPHNTACRNLDDSGTLSGKLTRNYFAVMIVMWPDHSQCYFTGTVAESLILGDYECLQEARIVEIGRWQVRRSG